MTDSPSDDPRSAEAHMRRVLGLQHDTPRSSPRNHSIGNSGSHPQRRRFVRDGEVPVTVIYREHNGDADPGANQLEAARQAIRSQAAARERTERLLEQAQAAIRELQTRNAHERLAKDEAVERATATRLAGDQARCKPRTPTSSANARCATPPRIAWPRPSRTGWKFSKNSAERPPRTALPPPACRGASPAPPSSRPEPLPDLAAPVVPRRGRKPKAAAAVNGEAPAKPTRGPGRPRKAALVEWWKPGWNSRA